MVDHTHGSEACVNQVAFFGTRHTVIDLLTTNMQNVEEAVAERLSDQQVADARLGQAVLRDRSSFIKGRRKASSDDDSSDSESAPEGFRTSRRLSQEGREKLPSYSGVMVKKGYGTLGIGVGHRWKQRVFFLENGYLSWYNDDDRNEELGHMQLIGAEAWYQLDQKADHVNHEIFVQPFDRGDNPRVYELRCGCEADAMVWLKNTQPDRTVCIASSPRPAPSQTYSPRFVHTMVM